MDLYLVSSRVFPSWQPCLILIFGQTLQSHVYNIQNDIFCTLYLCLHEVLAGKVIEIKYGGKAIKEVNESFIFLQQISSKLHLKFCKNFQQLLRGFLVSIRRFSGQYFPVFALNTGKYRPENSEYGHFSHSID